MVIGSFINERTTVKFIRLMNQFNSGEINQEKLIESLQKLRDEHMEEINEARRMGIVDIQEDNNMSKTDALNQRTVCRIFRQLQNIDIGLTDKEDLYQWLQELKTDYYEDLICIMEGIAFDDN